MNHEEFEKKNGVRERIEGAEVGWLEMGCCGLKEPKGMFFSIPSMSLW